MDSVFSRAMVGLITVGILGMFYWLARRSYVKLDAATGALTLRYGKLFRAIGIITLFAGPVLVGTVAIAKPPSKPSDFIAMLAIIGLFALIGGPLTWETMRFSITATNEGLDCRSAWRARRFLRWNEIDHLSYSIINSWFIITAKDGWKIRASVFIPGLKQFLSMCEQRLSPDKFEDARPGYDFIGKPFPDAE